MKKILTLPKNDIQDALNKANSIREALALLGFSAHHRNYTSLHRACQAYEIVIPKFSNRLRTTIDQLKENSRIGNYTAKRILVELNICKNECADCGLSDIWNNKKLVLQLDHINGKNTDYRIENLRLLCPNCHSQTSNWCGRKNRDIEKPIKKKVVVKDLCKCGNEKWPKTKTCKNCYQRPKKIVWPPREELLQMLSDSNFLQVSKKLGVSDNAIRKHLKQPTVLP